MDPSHGMASQTTKWKASPTQLQILKDLYDQLNGASPRKESVEEIVATLSQHGRITEKNVKSWFDNRRRRERNQEMVSNKDGQSGVCSLNQNTMHSTSFPQLWTPTKNQLQMLNALYDPRKQGTLQKSCREGILAALRNHGPITERQLINWFRRRRTLEKTQHRMVSSDGCPADQNTAGMWWTPNPNQLLILNNLYPEFYDEKGMMRSSITGMARRMKDIITALSLHGPTTKTNVTKWFDDKSCYDTIKGWMISGNERLLKSFPPHIKNTARCYPSEEELQDLKRWIEKSSQPGHIAETGVIPWFTYQEKKKQHMVSEGKRVSSKNGVLITSGARETSEDSIEDAACMRPSRRVMRGSKHVEKRKQHMVSEKKRVQGTNGVLYTWVK